MRVEGKIVKSWERSPPRVQSILLFEGIKFALHLAEIYNAPETLAYLQFGPERIGHGTFIHPATGTYLRYLVMKT
jgi:hypothetical protein